MGKKTITNRIDPTGMWNRKMNSGKNKIKRDLQKMLQFKTLEKLKYMIQVIFII